jgi:predicted NBD/HSP70 family sugar kinase
METLWGIDLGGTKTEGVVLQTMADKAEVIARIRIPTQREKGYDHILTRIGEVVELLKKETGLQPAGIGFGTPGALDPSTQRMKNCNTTALNDRPLKADLERRLKRPVRIANDANCFAVAETRMGAVAQEVPDAEVVFGLILGTGVGGGLVVNGRPIKGRHGIAGEWGHNFLDESGGTCYCGRAGCVETVLSGPALEKYYALRSNNTLKLPEIIERARSGEDGIAVETLRRLIHFFGKGIAQVINIVDPHAIVIGGGLGNIEELYGEDTRRAIQAYLFNPRLKTAILKPQLGDSAGVFGAALLMES